MTSPLHGGPRPPFTGLAEHLVALRGAARLSQRGLATAAAVSRGTVQRAESGTAAPSAAVLDALVRACGGDQPALDRARILRARGRTEHRDRLRGLEAPAPALIHTPWDLSATLAAQYEIAGAPPLSDLIRPTGNRTRIPRTTAWRIIRRRGLPANAGQLQTFLDVCRVRRSAQQHLHEAFQRVRAARRTRPAPPQHTLRPAPVTPRGRGTEKITPYFRDLMDAMSPEQIEAALTIGTAYLIADEAHRNGTAPPRSIERVLHTAGQLFTEHNRLPAGRSPDRFPGVDFSFSGPDGPPVLVQAKYYRGAPQGAGSPGSPRTRTPLSRPMSAWEWKSGRPSDGPRAG
ncbi:helix-turn-helix transcriptional regulator [Streptomyces sp. NPDC050204]|uniref:helix-turn-helix domain-containing protein n=1 Tax=Streptomyces sp. NPDC050204 TaxID=3155514 RepID=UPI003424596C